MAFNFGLSPKMAEFDYHIRMDIRLSINELRERLARRLTKKIAQDYMSEFRNNVSHRFQDIPNRPGHVDLIIEDIKIPQAQAVLEFHGPQGHLGFYVQDSARNILTRKYVCDLLNSMPDMVCKGM